MNSNVLTRKIEQKSIKKPLRLYKFHIITASPSMYLYIKARNDGFNMNLKYNRRKQIDLLYLEIDQTKKIHSNKRIPP